jgi:membrane protein involved in colicin uptake
MKIKRDAEDAHRLAEEKKKQEKEEAIARKKAEELARQKNLQEQKLRTAAEAELRKKAAEELRLKKLADMELKKKEALENRNRLLAEQKAREEARKKAFEESKLKAMEKRKAMEEARIKALNERKMSERISKTDNGQPLNTGNNDAAISVKKKFKTEGEAEDLKIYERNISDSLMAKYPKGVTVENSQHSNYKLIRVIVVKEDRATEYKKFIYNWGSYYKKNGLDISESVFRTETGIVK